MKYKVLMNFIDEDTSEKYLVNQEYETTSLERGKELVSKDFLKEIKDKKSKRKTKGAESIEEK